MKQFVSSVGNDTNFDHVQESWNISGGQSSSSTINTNKLSFIEKKDLIMKTSQSMESILKENSAFHGILPKQILLVTNDDIILASGKEVGLFTVKYRSPSGLFGQVTTDFMATSAIEIQDALEELNGVALRGSAFAHRSS
jgi:hypothetical protein